MVYMNEGGSTSEKTQKIMRKYQYLRRFFSRTHGNGINYLWHAEESPKNIRVYNSFDSLEYHGVDGCVDFVVVIPKGKPLKFKVQYQGNKSRYYANKYQLTEYLDDLFYKALSEAVKSQKKNPRKR